MLGRPNAARAVGYALNGLSSKRDDPAYQNIPWQRVVNSQGRISIGSRDVTANRQAILLREEGVEVSEALKIDLDIYLWEGLHLIEIDDILAGLAAAD
jgi:methylated-DNA-protein-cysteine methyltransferase-like protein